MNNNGIVKTLITPYAKNINEIFQQNERYLIDIYQRDYKWDKIQVETLLRDIELRFNLTERKNLKPPEIKNDVINRFKPYFLNTFLTCKTSNYFSIVDGQQRLTTILIILIKLSQLINKVHIDQSYEIKTVIPITLEKLIFETNDFGEPESYKIFNPNRHDAFDAIRTLDTDFKFSDETQKRITGNYEIISKYLNLFFKPKESDLEIDVIKLTYYIYYILEKLNIVDIKIEQQENVATIFEVVNDRGLGLKPYEILKGKLIGNLSNLEKESANKVWVELQNAYYNTRLENSTEKSIDLDTFFRTYLRANFADSETEYQKFEDKYHYEIYSNEKILNYFGRFEDNERLYKWVTEEFKYFAELYLYLRTTYDDEYLIYNKLLDQNQQYLLIMSCIDLEDKNKKEKINAIAKKFDQFHSILRLLNEYESNKFQNLIYKLNTQIRNKSIDESLKAFDRVLIEYLESEEVVGKDIYKEINELFKWELLQDVRNNLANFSKYVLMRTDRYLAYELDKPSYCKESLKELEDRFNKNNKKQYGMHLEHIYAQNDKNYQLFTKNGVFDEGKFKEVRNKLGMLLLLKDRQNISSNNDYYNLKIEDYKTSNLIWNELLVGHIDIVDRRNLPPSVNFTKIDPDNNGVFPIDKVDTRQQEIFNMIKLVWCF